MTSDNYLSKTVRPAVLIIFIFIFSTILLLIFIDSGFITFVVDDEWKDFF